jgi:DNA-binding CsgD family transcriptional regulator
VAVRVLVLAAVRAGSTRGASAAYGAASEPKRPRVIYGARWSLEPQAPRDENGIAPRRASGVSAKQANLTARERQVLTLVASGLRDRQIATQLGLSENTVRTHARHMLAKLGASSRPHAVAIGFSLELLRPIKILEPGPRREAPEEGEHRLLPPVAGFWLFCRYFCFQHMSTLPLRWGAGGMPLGIGALAR